MTAAPPVIPGLASPEVIGRGGYGVVYAADEPEFDRRVALKVLAGRLDGDDMRRAFARECQAMGRLSGHPNIVTVHRGGTTAHGEPFIVMALLPGGSLGDRLRREGPLPWAEAVETGIVVAGALETAHRAGVLHLDVKPANVLVSRFGDAVLSDFGISRLPGVTSTLDGRVRASAAYAAPERLMDGGASVAVDLYGLGATLFALLTGRPAFVGDSGEDLIATMTRVVHDPVPDLRQRGVPGQVADVVERLMAKDPAARYPSAAAVATALQDVQRALLRPVTRAVIEGTAPAHGDSGTWPAGPRPDSRPIAAAGGRGPAPPGPDGTAPPWPSGPGSSGSGPTVPRAQPLAPHQSAPTLIGPPPSGPPFPGPPPGPRQHRPPLVPVTAAGPPRRPSRPRRRGRVVALVAAGLVVGAGAVTAVVVLTHRSSSPTPVPVPTITAGPAPATTTAAPVTVVTMADGIAHPARDEVRQVLSQYVAGIDDKRYADAFALFSPDSQSAKGGLPTWQQAQSTSRITDARLVDVTDAANGDLTAEMTFTSTQAAQFGPNGQTCTRWDLLYTLTGPGHLIRGAKPAKPPQACA